LEKINVKKKEYSKYSYQEWKLFKQYISIASTKLFKNFPTKSV
jgi:hypothetical protein